jgi:hypothetical protein
MSTLAQKKRRSTPSTSAASATIWQYLISPTQFWSVIFVAKLKPVTKTNWMCSVQYWPVWEFWSIALIDWILAHYETCRPQDVTVLSLTLATANFLKERAHTVGFKVSSNINIGAAEIISVYFFQEGVNWKTTSHRTPGAFHTYWRQNCWT